MNIGNIKRVKKHFIKDEGGFVFAITAMAVVVLISLMMIYLRSTVMLNISEAGEIMSTSQSYWSAVSGLEYAYEEASSNIDSVPGTYTYYNSTITIDSSFVDNDGNPLSNGEVRLISTGVHGDTKRIVASAFDLSRDQDLWPSISVILSVSSSGDDEENGDGHDDEEKKKKKSHDDEEHDDESDAFKINENAILNCSLFIGGSVEVESNATVGSPSYGGPTTIYVPTGQIVTGDFTSTFDWEVYPNPTPALPGFNHGFYDSLINIAESVSNTIGNEHDGDLEIELTTFDLSVFANRTYFVDGDIKIKGSTVTGGSLSSNGHAAPGILVASGKIEVEKKSSTQSFIDNNIILIAKEEIEIEDYSQVGSDYSSISLQCRPFNLNELYAKDNVEIKDYAEVWAIVTSRDELKLEDHAKLYGIAHAPDNKLYLDENTFIEGAIFVLRMDHNKFKEGQIRLTHCFPMHFKSVRKFVPIISTFKEI